MKPLPALVCGVGAVIAVIGIVGVFAPAVVFELGAALLSPSVIYIVAAVRIAIGVLLWHVAPDSRMPTALRVVGVIVVIAGLATPLFGVERSEALIAWLSGQESFIARAVFALPIVFGAFLAYAVSRRRIAA